MSRYKETIGYVIHQRDFKDSSVIIDFFSYDIGLLQIIAKGIKKNKLLKSQLQYFSLLKIQYFGKSQLKTITTCNLIESTKLDDLIPKTAGLYLNELLHLSLIERDRSQALFNCYAKILLQLGKQKLTPLLRQFEMEILKYNGYELEVSSFSQPDSWLTITESSGLVITTKESEKLCQVSDLKKFINSEILDRYEQKRINKIMIQAINISLSHRKIHSRELLKFITTK